MTEVESEKRPSQPNEQPENEPPQPNNEESNKPTTNGASDPYQKYKDFKWENPDEFRNGPIGDESRKCRDIFCLIFFMVFLVACIVVAILGFVEGHPSYLLYGYDEDGKACGHSKGYEKYPYLYFYSVITNLQNLSADNVINGVCVSECPKENINGTDDEIIYLQNCKGTENNTDCKMKLKDYYQSEPLLNTFCFPMKDEQLEFNETFQRKIEIYDADSQTKFTKTVNKDDVIKYPDNNGKEYIKLETVEGKDSKDASAQLINYSFFSGDRLITWIKDLYVTRWALAGSLLWSFVIAMVFLLFLRLCAGFIVFLIILIIQVGLIVLAVYFKYSSDDHDDQNDTIYHNTMLALFWIFILLALAWLIFIIAMCNRIRLAVALIQVTAKYLNNTWSIIFIPFLFFAIMILWIAYWISLSIFLYATGELGKSKVIASFEWTSNIRYAWWFHLFSLFYITAIISAYSQFVYSSSACIWYFTSEKGTEDHYIRKSFKRGIRYHFGSLAFGSFIIALCRFIMVWFEYIKKRVEKTSEKVSESKCFKCIMSCLQCCVGCIGKIMEFINKHAYIQIALKGDSFCTAAWEGFALIVRNLGRFSTLAMIGSLFTTIGTIFISVCSAIIGYFLITEVPYFADELNSCVLPVVVFLIIGFIMGLVTMSIFGISGDALMHAFLLDEELNKGQAKAFPELQKFMKDER